MSMTGERTYRRDNTCPCCGNLSYRETNEPSSKRNLYTCNSRTCTVHTYWVYEPETYFEEEA